MLKKQLTCYIHGKWQAISRERLAHLLLQQQWTKLWFCKIYCHGLRLIKMVGIFGDDNYFADGLISQFQIKTKLV